MALNRERITLNPYEESSTNAQLEIGGDRFGHGVFVQTGGAQWGPSAQETPQLAQSVDTEGALVAANTISTRQSPVIKIQVLEPDDPADTNFIANPGCIGGTGYTQNAATGSFVPVTIRDLQGFDNALFQGCPGLNANEGIKAADSPVSVKGGGGVNPPYVAGVWLKGAIGGEGVTLQLCGTNASATIEETYTSSLNLTNDWVFYTLPVNFANASSVAALMSVYATSHITAMSFYATGFIVVQNNALVEYFDGYTAGCEWDGEPNASPSSRPSSGGPRMNAIMADIESVVTYMSRNHTGQIRRTIPTDSGPNTRVTFDVLNAQLNWDDLSMQNAGVAKGTISFVCEPYGRGPEMTTYTDLFNPLNPALYTAAAGSLSNFTFGATGLDAALNVTTENQIIYTGGEYPMMSGEATAQFTPLTTITNFKGGVIIEWTNVLNYMTCYVTDNGTSSFLKIDKIVDGVLTNLSSTTLSARIASGTTFTIRARTQRQAQNDNVYVEYFASTTVAAAQTAAPTNAVGPLAVTNSAFGCLVPSFCGIDFTPVNAGALCVQFRQDPYLARERSLPALRFGVAGAPGSVAPLGRMVISEISLHDQYWAVWGQQADSIGRQSALTDLYFEAENLTPLSGAAVNAGPGGSSGTTVQFTKPMVNPLPILSSHQTGGEFAHIGNFNVYVRIYQTAGSVLSWSLQWSTGDFAATNTNASVVVNNALAGWQVINLGLVSIPPTAYATQQWSAQVLVAAGTSSQVNDTCYIDCLWLVPNDAGSAVFSGKEIPGGSGTVNGADAFTTSNAALGGTTAQIGGAWATSGATTDLATPIGGLEVTRSTTADTGPRFALLGSTSRAAQRAQITFSQQDIAAGVTSSLLFRAQSATPPVSYGVVNVGSSGGSSFLQVQKVVSGASNILGSTPVPLVPGEFYTMEVWVDADGRIAVFYGAAGLVFTSAFNNTPPLVFLTYDPVFATAGTLATGLYGFADENSVATPEGVRQYTNFVQASLVTDSAIFSGTSAEIRSNQANRYDANSVVAVPESFYQGQYMTLPQPIAADGVDNIVVKASRLNQTPQINGGYTASQGVQIGIPDVAIDAIQAQVNVTPRYTYTAAF